MPTITLTYVEDLGEELDLYNCNLDDSENNEAWLDAEPALPPTVSIIEEQEFFDRYFSEF